jgi:hypothetical protein
LGDVLQAHQFVPDSGLFFARRHEDVAIAQPPG